MRIYLKKNWAKNIDFDSEDAIYVGRTSELAHLKSYLINNNSGSILISGLRGVGKTAFVNKLAIELIKEYSKPPSDLKLLPVMVNISQIDIENQNVYDLLIRLIIRRLYNQLSEEGNKEIELLYRKTFCDVTKFQELNSENDIEEIDSQVNQTRFDINVDNIIRTILIIAGSIFVLEDFGIVLKILGIASLVGTSFHYTKFFEKQRKIRQKRNLTTKEIYRQDNSTDNLEFDLKEFLRNNRQKYKFLFIIDELDKIDEENVFKVMRFYKNLFTSSNANYLFITDQKIYDKIVHSNKASDTHSTLFTHKIFLTDPTYKELRLYSEAIVDKYQDNEHTLHSSELDENQQSLVSNIFDFLLFESQLDYFNLKRLINELLDYDGTTPFLNTIELREENNYEVIKLKATVLKLLSQVYEVYKFKYYNNLMQNQNNLDILFSCFHKYTTSNFKFFYDTPSNSLIVTNLGDPSQIDKIIDSSESHILNLLNLLSRYSILQYKDSKDGNGYYWTGKIPSEIFEKPDYLLTAEKAFVNEFGLLIEIVNNIDDLQTNNDIGEYDEIFQGHDASEITGLNAYPVFNKYNSYYEKLLKTVPEHVTFDNLKTYTKELSEFNKKLFDSYLQILANLIKIRLKKVNFAISKLTANQSFLPTLSEFKSLLMKFNHFIIFSPDLSRQIIIFDHFDIQAVVASQTIKLIKDQENSVLLITISRNKSEPIDKISIKHKQEIGLLKNGKPKYRVQSITLRNYKNFHFQDSFEIFFEIYNFIDNWLNK